MTQQMRRTKDNERRIGRAVLMMVILLFMILFCRATVFAEEAADSAASASDEIKETTDVPVTYTDTGTEVSLEEQGEESALSKVDGSASSSVTAEEETDSSEVTDAEEISDTTASSDDADLTEASDDEESNGAASDSASSDTISTANPSVKTPLAPKDGSAEIIEYTDGTGKNNLSTLTENIPAGSKTAEVYKNDVPSVNHIVVKDLNTGATTDDYWTVAETGQCVEIDADSYPLPKTFTTDSSTPVNAVQTTTTTYVSKNAIQKAIDNALAGYSNCKDSSSVTSYEITIAVDPGEYDGDIYIERLTGSSDFWDKLTLYIVARDAFTKAADSKTAYDKTTISASADGSVHVNGSLKIENIRAVLAGLFFSSDTVVYAENAQVTLYGTAGEDTLTLEVKRDENVAGGDVAAVIYGGAGDDTISVTEHQTTGILGALSNAAEENGNAAELTVYADDTASVNGNSENNVVTLDVSIANEFKTVNVSGSGRIHFTGTLKKDGEGSAVLSHDEKAGSFIFKNSSDRTVTVMTSGFAQFTDSLTNKVRVELNEEVLDEGKVVIYLTDSVTLTDYYLDTHKKGNDGSALFVYDVSGNKTLRDIYVYGTGFLTGLVIDDLQYGLFENYRTLYVGNIEAEGMNVRIDSHRIVFSADKAVSVNNLIASAAFSDTYTEDTISKLADGIFSFNCDASIRTEKGSQITSGGTVVFTVDVSQTQNLLFAERASLFNLKMGDAVIVHNGLIRAGGSVLMTTSNKVLVKSGNNAVADMTGIFFALNFGIIESTIDVADTASITADGSVALKAASDVDASANAVIGKLPAAIALAYIKNDTHVDVRGIVTAVNGNVTLDASSVNQVTSASSAACADKFVIYTDENGNYTGATSGIQRTSYGAYLAASGAVLNTYAAVQGNGSLYAKGDITISSSSKIINSTSARTTDAGTAGTVSPFNESENSLVQIALNALDQVMGLMGSSADQTKLKEIEELFVSSSGYQITLTSSGNGTVSSVYRAKAGDAVDLLITPDEGYSVESVQIRYLADGEYITRNIEMTSDGEYNYYMFEMPSSAVIVTVTFRDKADADPVLVNRSTVQQGVSAADALASANQKYFKNTAYGTDCTLKPEKASWYGTVTANTDTANAGQKVLFVAAPENGYSLKTLTVSYTANGKKYTETVPKSTTGYVFTLPEGITGTLSYTAEFEEAASSSSFSADDKKGCIAAGVVINTNKAFIDTTGDLYDEDGITGSVVCGGNLSVSANEVTQSSVWADASAVKQVEETVIKPLVDSSVISEDATHQTARTESVLVQEGDYYYQLSLVTAATAGGTCEIYKDSSDIYQLKFKITPDDGYTVSRSQLLLIRKADGTPETVDLKAEVKDGETWYVVPSSWLSRLTGRAFTLENYTDAAKITVLFSGNSHTIAWAKDSAATPVQLPANAGCGSVIRIPVSVTNSTKDYNYRVLSTKGEQTVTVSEDGSSISFVMPDGDVTIKAEKKPVAIAADTTAKGLISVQSLANKQEIVKITALSGLKNGLYDYSFLVTTKEGKKIDLEEDGVSFKVPYSTDQITISVVKSQNEKPIKVTYESNIQEAGTVTGNLGLNQGDTLTVTIVPNAGYVLDDSLPVTISYQTAAASAKVDLLTASSVNGIYTYTLPEEIYGKTVTVYAKFKESENPSDSGKSKTALGAAAAVGVCTSTNLAEIRSGVISADSISLDAESGTNGVQMKSEVLSNAGYFSGNSGFAGALSVNVAEVTTKAQIENKAEIHIGTGSLKVNADCRSQVITKADAASPDGAVAKTGVGAGISVQVANLVTKADIADGTVIIQKTDADEAGKETIQPVGDVTVKAQTVHTETVGATAGSAGGNAVTPVVTVIVSGVQTDAFIGSAAADQSLISSGDVTITAETAVSRTANAKGNAAATGSAIGGSVSVSVVNDSAKSHLKRNVKAKNVSLTANARTFVNTSAQAGSKGGRAKKSSSSSSTGDKGSDDDADADPEGWVHQQISSALRLSSGFSEGGAAGNNAANALYGRKKAQTTEGNVTAAGAVNFNYQTTTAVAEIADGLLVDASGKVSVVSAARSDAYVTATSSAVGSDIGIGVSAAVNVVTITNHALIGSAQITAASLEVGAITPTSSKEAGVRRQALPTQDNILTRYTKAAVDYLFDKAMDKMGLSEKLKKAIGDELKATLVSAVTEISETMLNGTGLKELISADIWTKLQETAKNFTKGMDDDKASELVEHMGNLLVNTILNQMAQKFMSEDGKAVQPKYLEDYYDYPETMVRQVTAIANEFLDQIMDPAQFINFIKNNWKQTLVDNWNTSLKKLKVNVGTHATNILLNLLDVKSEVETAGDRSTVSTEAISGAGSGDVGVGGAVAVAVVNNDVKALIAGMSEDFENIITLNIEGNILVEANDKIRISTVGSSAANQDGTADQNEGAGADSTVSGNGDGTYNAKDLTGTGGKLHTAATTHGEILDFTNTAGTNAYTVTIRPDSGYVIGDTINVKYEYTLNGKTQSSYAAFKKASYDEAHDYYVFTGNLVAFNDLVSATAEAAFTEKKIEIYINTSLLPGYGNATWKVMDTDGKEIECTDGRCYVAVDKTILIQITPEDGYTLGECKVAYNKEISQIACQPGFNKKGGNTIVFTVPSYREFLAKKVNSLFVRLYMVEISDSHPALIDDGSITLTGAKVGVGASFALTYEKSDVLASIGANRNVKAGSIEISAVSDHNESTKAVAGVDPLSAKGSKTKNSQLLSVDAAVALSIIDSSVKSTTGENCAFETTKGNNILLSETKVKDKDGKEKTVRDAVDFYMNASEKGTAKSIASSFAVGLNDAVGANVALVVDSSDVQSIFNGSLQADVEDSDIRILSASAKTDVARGTATSVGADIERYFTKFGKIAGTLGNLVNQFVSGDFSIFNKAAASSDYKTNNNTADLVNGYLNKNKSASGSASDASSALPTSVNISRVIGEQNISVIDSVNKGLAKANSEIANAQGSAGTNTIDMQQTVHVQVAAVVAVTVLNHNANTQVNGTIIAGPVRIESTQNANFASLASAAAMSRENMSNSIAGAIAVTVDNNHADTFVNGSITAKTNDITIRSQLTENCGKGFNSNVTAQSISGSVTGEKASVTVSAAVSVVVSNSSSKVEISNGSKLSAPESGAVIIRAYSKDKLSVRAGAISLASQTAVGTGASFALIYDNSTVSTVLGTFDKATGSWNADRITVSGGQLLISAVRDEVSSSDRKAGFGLNFAVTKSTKGQPSTPGLVNFEQDPVKKTYTATVNFNTDKILDLMNFANSLISNNYYAEAISGDIVTDSSRKGAAAVSGSMAMIFYRADTGVRMGSGITLSSAKETDISASDRTTSVLVAGALNVSPALAGVGATVGSFDDHANIYCIIGDGANITAGSYSQKADNAVNTVIVTIAANEATGSSAKASVGGVVTVANLQNTVRSTLGDNSTVLARTGSIAITADADTYLFLLSLATPGAKGTVAAGGTVGVCVAETTVEAAAGNDNTLTSNTGSVSVQAASEEKLINVLAAVSPSVKSTVGVAATIGVTVGGDTVKALVGDRAKIMAAKDISITSSAENWILSLDLAGSYAKGKSVGGAVIVNVFNKTVKALVGADSVLHAGGNILVSSYIKDWELLVAATAGAAKDSVSVTGVIPVCISSNTARAEIGARTEVRGDSVGILSIIDSDFYTAAGGVDVSIGKDSSAFGATVSTVVNNNKADALVDTAVRIEAAPTASSSGITLTNRKERRRGITIYAGGNMELVSAALGVAAGAGKNNATAVVSTVVMNNSYTAAAADGSVLTLSEAPAEAGSGSEGTDEESGDSEDSDPAPVRTGIFVETVQNLTLVDVADAAAVSGGTSIGGAVSTLVINSTVKSEMNGTASAGKAEVSVHAQNKAKIVDLTLTEEGGKNAGGAAIQTLVASERVQAALDGSVLSAGDVSVTSSDDLTVQSVVIQISGSISNNISGAAAITVLNGTTTSSIGSSKADPLSVNCSGKLTVTAESSQYINADTDGAGGAKTINVLGGVDVVVSHLTTKAWIGGYATVQAGGDLVVMAENSMTLKGVAVYAGGSGNTSANVAALVMVDVNTVYAAIEENCSIKAADVTVQAVTKRDITAVSAAAGGGATGTGGAAVTVIVSGNRMTQDAYAIMKKGTDPTASVKAALGSSGYTKDLAFALDTQDPEQKISYETLLTELLAGDGQTDSYRLDVSKYQNASSASKENSLPGSISESTLRTINGNDTASDEITDAMLGSDDRYDTDVTVKEAPFDRAAFKSSVSAVIGAGTFVTAKNITVKAIEEILLTEVSGQAAGAGTASGGSGLSVAVFNTTVQALVSNGAVLQAEGTITVYAGSRVPEQKNEAETNESDTNETDTNEAKDALTQQLEKELSSRITATEAEVTKETKDQAVADDCGKVKITADNKIILIGFAANVSGTAGVSANGSVFVTHDHIYALSEAKKIIAQNLTIQTAIQYKEVLSVSTGVSGGGQAAVSVSLAMVYYNADVQTGLAGNTEVQIRGKLFVHSDGTVRATTASANLAASGMASSAVNIALTINKIHAQTIVGQGVYGTVGELEISNAYSKSSHTYGITLSFGYAGAGLPVVVAVDKLNASAVLGYDDETGIGKQGTDQLLTVNGTTTVSSVLSGNMFLLGVPVEGNFAGVNVLVTVGINSCTGVAEIAGKTLSTGSLKISALLTGNVTINTVGVTGQFAGAGAQVAVGKQSSTNRAILNLSGKNVTVKKDMTVTAGLGKDQTSKSDVTVKMYAFAGKAFGASMNFAVALNNSENTAMVINKSRAAASAKGSLSVETGDARITAYGKAYAYSFAITGSVQGVGACPTLAYAKIGSIQRAYMDLSSDVRIGGNLVVESVHNAELPDAADRTWSITAYKYENNKDKIFTGTKDYMAKAFAGNGTAGIGNIIASIAISKANATSEAYVKAASLTVGNSLEVTGKAESTASSEMHNFTIGGGCLGTTIAHAYAQGTFRAYVSSRGNITVNGSKGIVITNTYTSDCKADLTPSVGVNINVGNIMVNFAYAKSSTTAEAFIHSDSAGNIFAENGPVTVRSDGTTRAVSKVHSTIMSVSAAALVSDVAKARVTGTQKVYIEGAVVHAAALNVISYINALPNTGDKSTYSSPNTGTGAYAATGLPSGALEIVDVRPVYANAKSNMAADTYVRAKSLKIKGDVFVFTGAYSYAKAESETPDVQTITGAKVPITILGADSSGTYNTYVDVQGKDQNETTIEAGNIVILTEGNTGNDVNLGIAGGYGSGIDISLLTVSVNEARSVTTASCLSGLRGKGGMQANNVTVKCIGTSNAKAYILEESKFAVTGASAQAMEIRTYLDVQRIAALDYTGKALLSGNLQVIAQGVNTASADGGYPSGFSIKILSGSGIKAEAYTRAKTLVRINAAENKTESASVNRGTITVNGSFTAEATNRSTVNARMRNNQTKVSIIGIEAYLADAGSADVTTVTIGDCVIDTQGQINVHAKNTVSVIAESIAGNSFAVLYGTGGTLRTFVGMYETAKNGSAVLTPEETSISVEKGAKLNSVKGNISIEAENSSNTESRMMRYGRSVSIIGVTVNHVPTCTNLKTTVTIKDGAEVRSENGSVSIQAHDYAKARAVIDGNSIGLTISADKKTAENRVNSLVQITVQNKAVISAGKDVLIKAWSDANMDAECKGSEKGIFGAGGGITARNYLVRRVLIDIASYSQILSEHGNISILTNAGENDSMYCYTLRTSGACIAMGKCLSEISYESASEIQIGIGTLIRALDEQNGIIKIHADVSMGGSDSSNIRMKADDESDGVGGGSTAKADFAWNTGQNVPVLRASVTVDGTLSDYQAQIRGREVDIQSALAKMYVDINAVAEVKGVGGAVEADARFALTFDISTKINHAVLYGRDALTIHSTAEPTSHVTLYSRAKNGSGVGDRTSHAFFTSNNQKPVSITVEIGSNVTLESSRKIMIDAVTFKVNHEEKAQRYTIWTGYDNKGHKEFGFNNDVATTNIEDGAKFIFSSQQSPVVRIYKDASGKVQVVNGSNASIYGVKQVSVDDTAKTVLLSNVIDLSSVPVLEVHKNQNSHGLSKCTITSNAVIDEVTIRNETDYSLNIGLFDYIGITSKVNIIQVNCVSTANPSVLADKISLGAVHIYMEQASNVLFTQYLPLEGGNLTVEWSKNCKGGNLNTASGGITLEDNKTRIGVVWVHSLTVTNAANVGSKDNNFWVYLTQKDGQDPTVTIQANGSVYLRTAPAVIALYENGNVPGCSGESVNFEIRMQNISAGGTASVIIDQGVRINYARTRRMTTNLNSVGSPVYTKIEMYTNDTEATITRSWLEYYRQDSLSTATEYAYVLPNGLVMYVTKAGYSDRPESNSQKVTRITTHDGKEVRFDSIETTVNQSGQKVIYLKDYGLYLNCSTHSYYLGENAEEFYQVLNYEVKDGKYVPVNLDGTIETVSGVTVIREGSEGYWEEVNLASEDIERCSVTGYTGYGKWVYRNIDSAEGILAVFTSDHVFQGVFKAVEDGNKKAVLINSVKLSQTKDTDGKIWYYYTDDQENPHWMAAPYTCYYYVDKSNSKVYHSLDENTALYQSVEKTTIAGISAERPVFLLADPSVKNGTVYIQVTNDSSEGTATITIKTASVGFYIINSQLKFSASGSLMVNTNVNYNGKTSYGSGYTLNYYSNGLFSLSDRWQNGQRTSSVSAQIRLYYVEKKYAEAADYYQAPVLTITGKQKLRYINQRLAVDAEGIYYIRFNRFMESFNLAYVEQGYVLTGYSDTYTKVDIIYENMYNRTVVLYCGTDTVYRADRYFEYVLGGRGINYFAEIQRGIALVQTIFNQMYRYTNTREIDPLYHIFRPTLAGTAISMNFRSVGGGHTTISSLSASDAVIQTTSSESLTIGGEGGKGAVIGNSLTLRSQNGGNKTWASVKAVCQEDGKPVPFTFTRVTGTKGAVPEGKILFNCVQGKTLSGTVTYNPDTPGRLLIDASQMYIDSAGKRELNVNTNVSRENLTILYLQRRNSSGYRYGEDPFSGNRNSSVGVYPANNSKTVRNSDALGMLAWTFLSGNDVDDLTMKNLNRTYKKSGQTSAASLTSEAEKISSQIEKELRQFMNRHGLEELTAEEISGVREKLTEEERDEFIKLLLKKACLEILYGNMDQAEQYLEMAAQLDPDHALLALLRGDLCLQKGDNEKAEEYFDIYLAAKTGLEKNQKLTLVITLCDLNNAENVEERYRSLLREEDLVWDSSFAEDLNEWIRQWDKTVSGETTVSDETAFSGKSAGHKEAA